MRFINVIFKLFVLPSVLLVSCSDVDSVTEEGSSNYVAVPSRGELAGTTKVKKVSELNLTKVLDIDLDLLAGPEGQRLTASNKSFEACEIENIIDQGLSGLQTVKGMFCHLEIEEDKIEFGTKYSLTLIGEEEEEGMRDIGIWVDNSNAENGEIVVQMCQGGTLSEIIRINGVDSDKTHGSLIQHHRDIRDNEISTWSNSINFDVGFTEESRTFLTASSEYQDDMSVYTRQLVLDLIENGTSRVLVSNSGSWNNELFQQAGAVKLDDKFGQFIFSNKGTHGEDSYEWTHRGYFDSEGNVAEKNSSKEFLEDGSLFVQDQDVPKFLPENFTVQSFPIDAWDCVPEESLQIDMTGANGLKHAACDGDRDDEHVDCWDGSYEQSQEDHIIDEEKQQTHEEAEQYDHEEELPKEAPAPYEGDIIEEEPAPVEVIEPEVVPAPEENQEVVPAPA